MTTVFITAQKSIFNQELVSGYYLNQTRHQELVGRDQEVAEELWFVEVPDESGRKLVAVKVIEQGCHHPGGNRQGQGLVLPALDPASGGEHRSDQKQNCLKK